MKKTTTLLLSMASLMIAVATYDGWAADKPRERAAVVATDQKININTATEAELIKLKGVGEGLAKKIVAYRKANGDFKKPEDIRKVEGVGKSVWEKNREHITVK